MKSHFEQLQDIYIIYFIKLYWQHGNKQRVKINKCERF